jgi:serine/threonine protein kinase
MEYLPLGNLADQHNADPISTVEMQMLLVQAADALRYLHSRSITHRDIKPENILVQGRSAGFHIKLSDFGLSKAMPFLKTDCGTPLYLAPEIPAVQEKRKKGSGMQAQELIGYDCKVDIWSLGVLALQYIEGLPSHTLDWYGSIVKSVSRLVRLQPDEPLFSLLSSMLERVPSKRPSAAECLQAALAIAGASASTADEEFDGSDDEEDGGSGSVTPTTHDLGVHQHRSLTGSDLSTQILSRNDRFHGFKRHPSPTQISAGRTKRPRGRTYHDMVTSMLTVLQLQGILGKEDDAANAAMSVDTISDEFSRLGIAHIEIKSVGADGVTVHATRLDGREFALVHLSSSDAIRTPLDLALYLTMRASEEAECLGTYNFQLAGKSRQKTASSKQGGVFQFRFLSCDVSRFTGHCSSAPSRFPQKPESGSQSSCRGW